MPSPSQDAMQSIADLPGSLNTGRIILIKSVPTKSRSPKFKRSGKNSPANKNTENSIGSNPSNIVPPVFAE